MSEALPYNGEHPRIKDHSNMLRFAREWVRRPEEPYTAAGIIIPDDVTLSCFACGIWRDHPVVQEERARILSSEGDSAKLPTKETIALELYEMAKVPTKSYSDRIAAYRELNSMLGFITKPGTQIGPVNVNNKVLVITDHGAEATWSDKLQRQQSGLQAEAHADIARDV